MGMGGNGNYFSGINGNGNKVSEFRSPGMGVGMKSWDWYAKSYSRTTLIGTATLNSQAVPAWLFLYTPSYSHNTVRRSNGRRELCALLNAPLVMLQCCWHWKVQLPIKYNFNDWLFNYCLIMQKRKELKSIEQLLNKQRVYRYITRHRKVQFQLQFNLLFLVIIWLFNFF